MITKIEKYYADWCFPCKTLDKTLENLPDYIELVKINIEEDVDLATEKGIRNIPVLIFYNENNEEVNRTVGSIPWSKIQESIG